MASDPERQRRRQAVVVALRRLRCPKCGTARVRTISTLENTDERVVRWSRRPVCGSSRRTKYENSVRIDFSGNVLEYVASILRTCRCVDCG